MLTQITENGLKFGDGIQELVDKINFDIESYSQIIDGFSQLNLSLPNFKDKDGKIDWNVVKENIQDCDDIAISYFQTLDDGKGTINNTSASVEGMAKHLKSTGSMFDWAALKAGIFNTVLNAGIGFIVSAGLQLVVKAIDDYVHRVDNAKEALDNFDSEIETKRNTYKSHAELIDKVSKSYDNLANKVDTETNLNLGLSEEEYSEFLNLTNEIADAFPTLVKGVDESGNAILDFGDDCGDTTEKLKELLETEKQLTNVKIASELPEYFKNTETVIEDYDKQITQFKGKLDELNNTKVLLDDIVSGKIDLLGEQNKFSVEDLGAEQFSELHNLLNESLSEFVDGLSSVEKLNLGNLNLGVSDLFHSDGQDMWLDLVGIDGDLKTRLESIIKDNVNMLSLTVNDELSNAQMSLNQAESSKESSWKDFTQNLVAGMNSKASFQALSAEGQQLATALVQGLNSGVAKEMSDKDPYKYVQDNIIAPLSSLNENDAKSVSDSYKKLLTLNPNDLSEINQSTINSLLKSLAQILGKEENELRISLGFEINEDFKAKYDDAIKEATQKLGIDKTATEGIFTELGIDTTAEIDRWNKVTVGIKDATEAKKAYLAEGQENNETAVFKSFDGTEIGQRLQHASKLFNEGKISYKEYFDGLQTEIENVDFSHYTDSLEDAKNAAGQLFVDSTQQAAQGLTNLINSFNSNEMSVTEYLDGYLSIAETLGTLTDELQENSEAWDKNGEALSDSKNMSLDEVQSNLNSAIETVETYQDSIYGLEQILSGKLELGTDEFTAQTNVIAEDLANIVACGGEMSEEIKNYMGTSADEIAQSLTEDISNFDIASQAIASNTNVAIQNMATSIGELFEELGNAISNFKVDLSFGVSSITMQDVDMGILGTHQLPAVTFSLEASGDSLSSIGSAISSFGKNFSENMGQYIEYPDFTIEPEGNEYIPSDDVLNNYNNHMEKLKDASGKAGKDAAEEYKEALEKELSDLDTVLGFITDTIQDQIDAWEDAKDAAVNALEAQRDAAVEALEAQKEAVQVQIDAKQDEIDKIKEAREERQAEIDLQKKQYGLARLESQRTQLIYKDGHMIRQNDSSEIRDAREQVAEAKENIKILQIEKEISNLEDVIDSLDRQIDSINDHFDKLIKQTEAYYDNLIKGMEEYKSRWEELGEIEEQAKINVMLEELGITTDDVLNMSGEAFEQFKKRYLDILTEMHKGESDMVSAINEVADGIDTEKLSEGLDKTKENIDKLTKTDYSTVVNGVSGISNALNEIPSSDKYDNLANSFNDLAEAIQNVAIALGITGDESVSGLVDALQTLSEFSFGDAEGGVIAQFTSLKDAIDSVTSAITGGGSKANEGGGLATGANGGAATPTDGGGGGGLTSAISEIGTTTEETLGSGGESSEKGSDSESGGEGVIGKFSEFKSAVDDVIKIIGTDDEESSEDSITLISALRKHYEVANDTVPKVTGLFDELYNKISDCVTKLGELAAGMASLGGGSWSMMGTVPIYPNAKGTVGNAFAKGYNGLPRRERNALRSEYGQPELTVYPDGTTELTTKPIMSDLPKDTVIFNEDQTRRIMNGKGTILGKAFANGTAINPALTIQDINGKYLHDSFLNKLDDIILPINSINKNVESMFRMSSNIHNSNSMQPINLSIGDIQVHGVQDVNGLANAISTKLPNMLLQTITKR